MSPAALAEIARAQGLTLAGHLPTAVTVLEAVAAGQRSIEHAMLFILSCYPGTPALSAAGDVNALYNNDMRRKMIDGPYAAQLRANPLESVRAVREVDAVVLAGTLYDRAALDRLHEGAAAAAGSWTMWPKFVWQILNSPIMKTQFAD